MFQWLFFVIGNEAAFVVLVLYWTLVYRGEMVVGTTANIHLINGLISLVDLWVSGTPVNTLHAVYLMIFGGVYTIFSGIYFVLSRDIIYRKVLDYEKSAGLAVVSCFTSVFVVLPIIHIGIFYLQYVSKFWILHYHFGRDAPQRNDKSEENEEMDENQ